MSRRCCPTVEEGMAWGRGRWGCMALNSVRGKKNQKHEQGRMQSASLCENEQRNYQPGLLRQLLLCSVPRPPVRPFTYHLRLKIQDNAFISGLFSTVLCFFKQPLINSKAPFTFFLLSCLLCVLPYKLTPPSLIPVLARTSKQLSVHKQDSSSSSIPAPTAFCSGHCVSGNYTF